MRSHTVSANSWKWRGVILTLLPTVGVVLLRLTGWLQPLEWFALDVCFQLRSLKQTDNRVLIVGIEEQDITRYGKGYASLTNETLVKLLKNIKHQQPSAIGLDLYQNISGNSSDRELNKVFKTTPNLIGIEKVTGDRFSPKIAPFPVLKQLGQIASVDTVGDGDSVVRRGILFPISDGKSNIQSLGLALALLYLKERDIPPTANELGSLKLKNTVFTPLEENDGGYVRADVGDYQILLNYRGPAQSFPRVSITDILENKISSTLMRDRIILIGTVAPSINDRFLTPYSRNLTTTPIRTPGVELHANLASQIISAVLDNRPLIKTWNDWLETGWTILFGAGVVILSFRWAYASNTPIFLLKIFVYFISLAAIIGVISVIAFAMGAFWIPLVPPFLALCSSTVAVAVYIPLSKLRERNIELEEKNIELEEKKQDLENYSYDLEQKYKQLAESETRQKLALEASCTGIWNYDLIRDTITVFKNCDLIFGLEVETFSWSFKAFTEYIYPEDCGNFIQRLKYSIEEKKDYDLSFRLVLDTGSIRWVQVKGQVYCDEKRNNLKVARLLGTITNITESKELERASLLQLERHEIIERNISDIITILYSDWLIRYSNHSARKALGYARNDSDFFDKNDLTDKNFLDFIHPDDIDNVLNFLENLRINPTSNSSIEYRYRHRDGTWRILRSGGLNLLEHPLIMGVILFSQDITEYKSMESQLLNCRVNLVKHKEKSSLLFLGLILKCLG